MVHERNTPQRRTQQNAWSKPCWRRSSALLWGLVALLWGLSGAQARAKGSFKDYQKACRKGNSGGCLHLGFLFETGKTVGKKDLQEALRFYTRACELKKARGCTDAGVLWASGRLGKVSMYKAVSFYEKGCARHDHKGCFLLATYLEKDKPKKQHKKAHATYEKACLYGSGEACLLLGKRHDSGILAKKEAKSAVQWFRRACLWMRDHEACARWSVYLDRGKGVARDSALAQKNWQWSCNKKHALSCTLLGISYRDGRAGKPSASKAAKMFRLGCRFRNQQGCVLLARLFESGFGGKRNRQRFARNAHDIYLKACQRGAHQACFNAAVNYEKGRSTRRNHVKALQMYEKACHHGSGIGCYALAFHLQAGPPAVKAPKRAKKKRKKKRAKKSRKKRRKKARRKRAVRLASSKPVQKVSEARLLRLVRRACKLGYKPACKL
ncbi:MAG: sel1 repeat family protein [Myxococcales bacterium]|nr:sel1 repeat family protein [Myxococcales bacterium]MCB9642569.1 sel1 repeat family protein [Myxococcales bacterium]